CNSGLILPLINESIWSEGFRIFLYGVGLLWSFMAISIIADVFMCAIEVITSKTTEVKVARPELEEGFETVKVRVWNDTVAKLTFMALGSSAPEILLSVIEIVGNNFVVGELGPGTIVGSASFNLLVIVAVCIYSIPDGEERRIRRMSVFFTTAFFAVFAYGWIYIVLVVNTRDKVDLWEACVTFGFFPLLVTLAFLADKDICGKKTPKDKRLEIELGNIAEDTVLMRRPKSEDDRMNEVVSAFMRSMDKPEQITEEDASNIAALKMQDEMPHSRAWYRVKASRDLFAGQKINPHISSNLQRVIDGILGYPGKVSTEIEFDAVSCSVMENCGTVKIIVVRVGDISREARVRYETFDGTANAGDDYVATNGTLTFSPKQANNGHGITVLCTFVFMTRQTDCLRLTAIHATKGVINSAKSTNLKLPVVVFFIFNKNNSANPLNLITEPGTIEFTKPSYLVKESIGTAYIPLQRTNGADGVVKVKYRTSDVSGKDGVHYRGKQGTVTFEHGEDVKNIDIEIINDHNTKKDENFQVLVLWILIFYTISYISLVHKYFSIAVQTPHCKYSNFSAICDWLIQIFQFHCAECCRLILMTTEKNNCYLCKKPRITWILKLLLYYVYTNITILSASGGATLGHTQKTVVTVVGDDEFDGLVRRVVAKTHLKLLKMKLGSQSWSEQFTQAMTVNGGDVESATAGNYVMHFFTVGFKVIFAIVPPPSIWGGWACFGVSLCFIAILTAIVGDLAGIFGCLVNLKSTVNALPFVALGTSLPDLCASRILAKSEPHADNSIGNVTGSNSVNVFLGLGLPWVIASVYWKVKQDTAFPVPSDTVRFSIFLYSVTAIFALLTLVARHYIPALGGAELGGPKTPKIATVVFFILLWILYVLLSWLQAVGHIAGF
uniref:Calx-beta domain-containing protein n=1 Tax=Ciona savignyi TaxID=51511 RepID=H2Z6E7_CIOSA